MTNRFTLITGRTLAQAEGLHSRGSDHDIYAAAISLIEMNSKDMACLEIKEGSFVEVRSLVGQVKIQARNGDVPPGIVFIPMGPIANRLIGAETEGTGMPAFKGMPVEVVVL